MKATEENVHYCDDQKNKCFVVYNLSEKSVGKFEVPYDTVYLFDSVLVGNRVYFTGGGIPPTDTKGEQFFQTAVCVTILPDLDTTVDKLPNMNVSRANHTLMSLTPHLLYVIGGCNTKAEIPSCEEYSVDKKKWREIAYLNEKKMWVSVCGFQSKYLYAFGGSTNLTPKESNLIEFLDTTDLGAKYWTKIEIAGGKEIWPRCFFAGCKQIGETILLFGGLVNKIEVDDTYVFDPKAKTIAKEGKLGKPDAFYRTKPGMLGSEVTIVGSGEGDLHIYSTPGKKWSLLKKSTWNPEVGFSIKSDTL